MSSYARDLYINVRAMDQASRPLRRVARDVAGIQGRRQRTDVLRAQQAIVTQRLRSQQVNMAIERDSLANGRRAISQQKSLMAAEQALNKNRLSQRTAQKAIADIRTRDLANTRAMEQSLFRTSFFEEKRRRAVKAMGEERYTRALGTPTSRPAQYEQQLTQLAQQQAILTRSAASLEERRKIEKQSLAGLRNNYKLLVMEQQRAVAAGEELSFKVNKLTADMVRQSEAIALAEAKLAQYDAQIANDRLAGIARTSHDVARSLGVMGLAGTVAFGLMAKQAVNFNTQLRLAATQSTTLGHQTAQQVSRNAQFFQSQVTDLLTSGRAVAKPEDFSNSLYQIFSSVTLPGDQQQQLRAGITLLKEFNDVAKANFGLVDFNEVTKAGTVIMNDFDVSVKDIPKALNTMQAAVRYGAMNMGEFISTFNNAAPAAKAAGYSFEQMAEAIAFLSRKFPSVRVASAGYARLTEILARPDMVNNLRSQGVEITNLRTGALLPLEEIISRLVKQYPRLAKGGQFLQNFFKSMSGTAGTIQARRSFVFLNTGLQQFHNLSQQIRNDRNELSKSVAAMEQAPAVRWEEFVNQFKALVLVIGQQAIPAFIEVGRPIGRLLTWFNNLDDGTKHIIATWGVFISVGLTLAGGVAAIAGAFAGLVLQYRLLRATRGIEGMLGVGAADSLEAAAVGASKLTSEAGLLSVELASRLAPVLGVVLIPLLIHFRSEIYNAIAGTHGFIEVLTGHSGLRGALLLINIALTMLAVRMAAATLATRLAMVGLTRTAALFTALSASAAATAVAVGIAGYALSRAIRMIPGWDTGMRAIGGSFHKLFEDAPDPTASHNAMQDRIRTIRAQYEALRQAGKTPLEIRTQILKWNEDYKVKHDLEVWINSAQNYLNNRGGLKTRISVYDNVEAGRLAQNKEVAARNATIENFTRGRADIMKQVPDMIKRINELRRASETSPTVANLLKYNQYVAKLNKQFKDSPALLDAIKQAADAAFKTTATISDTDYVNRRRALEKTRADLEAHHSKSYAAWKAYYAAVAKLDKLPTDAQRQSADVVLQNTANITDAEYIRRRRSLEKTRRDLEKHHSRSYSAWKAYYAALAELEKLPTDSQRQAADAMLEVDTTHQKKRISIAKQAANERKKIEQDALQSLQSKYQEFYENNKQQFGELFSGPYMQGPRFQNMVQFGMHDMFGRATPRPQDALKDIRSQVNQFSEFRNRLGNLGARGLPQELLNQLQAQGPEAMPNLQALQRMTKKQLAEYARLWQRGQTQILQATKIDFAPEVKKWRIHGREISKAIAQGISDEEFSVFRNLKREILADLRGTKLPGHEIPKVPVNTKLSPNVVQHNDHSVTITVPPGLNNRADFETWLKHQGFRIKHQK
jgi:TP901 family phage tail tape measure protein